MGDREVRGSFALSYRGRHESERRVFRLLGMLAAPDFAVPVVQALLDHDPVTTANLIERLVDAQLLEVVGEDDFGQVRYRFHDLLRVFARERLREEESVSARRAALKRVLDAKLARARVADLVLQSGHVAPDRPALADADLGEQVRHDSLGWFSSEHAGLVAL